MKTNDYGGFGGGVIQAQEGMGSWLKKRRLWMKRFQLRVVRIEKDE